MRKNPSLPKNISRNRVVNVSRMFEMLIVQSLKNTISNMEYTQCLKRDWKDFNTGSKKAT